MATSVYIKPALIIFVAAVVIALSVKLFRGGSRTSAPVQPTVQNLPQGVDVTLNKARFSEIENGRVVWVLHAERVAYDKKGDKAYLTDIRMLFRRDDTPDAVTVTADSGSYSSTEKNVHLNGHVHVVTADGVDFKTDSIVYTGATSLFATSDRVFFQQEKMRLTAVGMNYNVKSNQSRFISVVEAAIIPK